MKSTYKKLGSYIREVDIRNIEDKQVNLLGVSTQKVFIKSIANTIGTDFTKYKVVKKHQFTYVPDTSRRGDKMGIALLQDESEGLVSQAYTVFEVIDIKKLLPEYLMMWFKRPEFDRYARYKSHGSVRELFDWEEMCNIELPVPSLEKQQAIVNEYNVLQNRIALNQKMNQKLEETAQAIYKQWFVDFEFPDENGNPYKSSGGEMVESELGEIPKGWEVAPLLNITSYLNRGITPNYTEDNGVIILNQKCVRNNTIDFIFSRKHDNIAKPISSEKYLAQFDILVNSTGTGTLGRVALIKNNYDKIIVDTHITVVRAFNISSLYLWFNLSTRTQDIEYLAEGSTGQTELSRVNLGKLPVLLPLVNIQNKFSELMIPIINHSSNLDIEIPTLIRMKDILLQKISSI